MKQIHYERLQETLYHEVMDNGLQVYVLPKPAFQKTYATFATKYGSVDNHFKVAGGEETTVPDGIAHFLEHKMFEEPEGDIFATFASNGASANAFTSFDQTVYLFRPQKILRPISAPSLILYSGLISPTRMSKRKKVLSARKSICTRITRIGASISV